jgi:hypothetical protein
MSDDPKKHDSEHMLARISVHQMRYWAENWRIEPADAGEVVRQARPVTSRAAEYLQRKR